MKTDKTQSFPCKLGTHIISFAINTEKIDKKKGPKQASLLSLHDIIYDIAAGNLDTHYLQKNHNMSISDLQSAIQNVGTDLAISGELNQYEATVARLLNLVLNFATIELDMDLRIDARNLTGEPNAEAFIKERCVLSIIKTAHKCVSMNSATSKLENHIEISTAILEYKI